MGDAPVDILHCCLILGSKSLRTVTRSHDRPQNKRRLDMLFDRLGVIVEHDHRNAGRLHLLDGLAKRIERPGG
ncbi:hypothetical protein D3C71_2124380 [compost metagenome]